jgi:mitochondrial fission protein ELM1
MRRKLQAVQADHVILAIQWIVVAGVCISLLTSYSLYRKKQELLDLMDHRLRQAAEIAVSAQPRTQPQSVLLAARNPKPAALESIPRK